MVDIGIELCGIKLKNPTVLASGILGVSKASLKLAAKNGAGAVTIKSISKEAREGHPNPTLITFEAGMLNAVGYSNPGLEGAKEEFKDLGSVGVPVIASVIGKEAKDFVEVVSGIEGLGFSAIEIPLSCPHTPGFGLLAGQGTPEATHKITSAVRDVTKLPIWVKISPSIQNIGEVAKAAEDAGADAITAVNTMGPGMVIDLKTAKPVLSFKVGGVSGPALRPVAVRCVYDVYETVDIPIIGTGGVLYGKDAIEMLMAGASAVGIATGTYYRGVDIFKKVVEEIKSFMEKEGYSNTRQIIGKAHE
jgi:dihydroorotate dehydrogenase (NAD+) catalytic subunit